MSFVDPVPTSWRGWVANKATAAGATVNIVSTIMSKAAPSLSEHTSLASAVGTFAVSVGLAINTRLAIERAGPAVINNIKQNFRQLFTLKPPSSGPRQTREEVLAHLGSETISRVELDGAARQNGKTCSSSLSTMS